MNARLFFAVVSAVVIAGPTVVVAAPALLVRDAGCVMLDGNGTIGTAADSQSQSVTTKNGVVVFTCQGNVAPSATGKAVKYDYWTTQGGSCGILTQGADGTPLFWITDDWQERVSASGVAVLICWHKYR